MKIQIITLFPELFDCVKTHSILGRAIKNQKVIIETVNLREFSHDNYGSVDDHPYGGGPGMVLKVDVVEPAIKEAKKVNPDAKIILMTPQGQVYKQSIAKELAHETDLILVCGHYEGFDERIREYCDMELSIGDYVLTGGELAAMVITDSIVRLLPGVLGDDASSLDESHNQRLLEYPHYTRPSEYEGKKVPEILLGGNHKKIEEWRKEQSIQRTKERRPDLISDKNI